MQKAVVFDLDGTLLDTLQDITDNLNIMLKRFGYPKVGLKETRQRIGNGAKNLVIASIPEKLSEDALKERLDCYNKLYTESGSPKTGLFDGIGMLLSDLKSRGFKIAILTNKPHTTTMNVYKEYLAEFSFDAVIGASDSVKHKPDPSATLDILEKLGVRPENAYFVGDGETDVKTSLNAGTKGIAVLWGYRDKAQLAEAGATVFAETPERLVHLIK